MAVLFQNAGAREVGRSEFHSFEEYDSVRRDPGGPPFFDPVVTTDQAQSPETMHDDQAFDFNERELFLALRLVLEEDEARRKAAEAVESLTQDMDWAISEQLLLAISLGSKSGHEKVQRWRTSAQAAERSVWLAQHVEEDPERAWLQHIASQDDAWEQKREELRQSLRAEGKLPNDSD